jgi:hypothetical protein
MQELKAVSCKRGLRIASATSFIRYAVEQELSVRQEGLTGAGERRAASVEQVRNEVFSLARTQQAPFAYLDTLTKALLTYVPEPAGGSETKGRR